MDSPPGADHVVLHDFAAPVLGYCREGDPHRSGGRIALEITAVTEAGTGFFALRDRTATVVPLAVAGAT